MSKKLLEYKQMLLDEFTSGAEVNSTSIDEEFIGYVSNMLMDNEEIYDLTECFFQMQGEKNRKILIDGFSFDDTDLTMSLFVTKFDQDDQLNTINQTEIDTYLKNMEAFVLNSNSRYIQKHTEQSSEGYQLADMLWNRINHNELLRFRFYIFTNSVLSDRVKNIQKENLLNRKAEVNVWDLNRLYNSDISNRKKETIFINVVDILQGKGLPCIKAFEKDKSSEKTDEFDSDYTAYLSVIPGGFLADLYDEYGSRLLEGNVRSFLSAAGKVNKGIQATILKEPKNFFTYNNGIAATASEVTTRVTSEGLEIDSIKDLQIINGGQTTASLLNTRIKYNNDTDLSDIFVPMKLTVLNSDNKSTMVERISRYANSQNKVSDADFFSNSEFHIRYEKLSRTFLAPAVNGNQYQTMWFYERARGTYKQEQMKLSQAERKKFLLRHPKSQLITKTDLAKYMNSYYQFPHFVSLGAQKNMSKFAQKIESIEKESIDNINEYFFKQSICIALMFKTLEADVKKASWFPTGSGYRANIVTYAISKLFYCIDNQYKGSTINFELVWAKQSIYPELRRILDDLAEQTFNYISSDDRMIMNISEWCKKEECWTGYKKQEFNLPIYFVKTLLGIKEVSSKKSEAKKEQKEINQIDMEVKVVELGAEYWQKLMSITKARGICNIIEEADLAKAAKMEITGRPPNRVISKRLLEFREKCSKEGIDIEKLR